MKKLFTILMTALMAAGFLTSCDEWDPVLTLKYDDPKEEEPVVLTPNISIMDLKALYSNSPVHIEKDYIIEGVVISSDEAGNIYRSLYIQDETGGIEIKIGKTGGLYNDYKLGQTIYVKCNGLTLGSYEGMLQLGVEDPTGSYDTAYMDVQYLIDQHVFKGAEGTPLDPTIITDESLLTSGILMGTYVTLKGLVYGNEVFCLLYIDPDKDKTSSSNRVFLSDATWGITTWAMSENKMKSYVESGVWDSAETGDGSQTVADIRKANGFNYAATYVSQYFLMGKTEVQVRTSGYADFGDFEIEEGILDGTKTVDLTGILTNYRGSPQFTLIDIDGVLSY